MRILNLDLIAGSEHGLKGSMRSLGQLVVLAGPNGAGKSRILLTVREVLSSDVTLPEIRASLRAFLEDHEKAMKAGEPNPYAPGQIETAKLNLRKAEAVTLDRQYASGTVFDFFPKVSSLADQRQQTEHQHLAFRRAVSATPELAHIEQRALAYVAAIERRWFAATHHGLKTSEEERSGAIAERDQLHAIVSSLLGEEIVLNLDQQPTLFGKPIADAKLSEGQSILLQVAVALHAQGSKLDGLVLLLDEPESHLHPTAIIEAIRRILSANPSGQVWIATHSVPVLAALPTESIWFVRDGTASWAGRAPETVLEGLLGGAAGREQVEEFLRLPAQFASNQFAAECLMPARVVNTGADDPQAVQIREFCKTVAPPSGRPLKLLDFGAGHGRLLSALHQRWGDHADFPKAIDYRSFEPFPDERNGLGHVVEGVYGEDGITRIFLRSDNLAMIDGASVDVVVMCNVLHEIAPDEWPGLFGKSGLISRLLAPSGYLLILEDMEIPHGEKAHRFGFLLLDRIHLLKLMACDEAQNGALRGVTGLNDRLKAHAIPTALLGKVTRESTRNALSLLRETALHEIKHLRERSAGSRDGRLHALWTQQLANADLGLSVL